MRTFIHTTIFWAALACVWTTDANAGYTIAPQGPKLKAVPATYTTTKPEDIGQADALVKALHGSKVYKCQEVELTVGKSSASLKPVKAMRD